jgi:hypothetical protein
LHFLRTTVFPSPVSPGIFTVAHQDIAAVGQGETVVTYGMLVQLPVSVAFGTDEEFDLRVRLERELAHALTTARAGRCAGGGIDTSHMNLHLEGISDPTLALSVVKEVLGGAGLLGRSVVVLETPCPADPDDRDLQVLWPPNHSGMFRVA